MGSGGGAAAAASAPAGGAAAGGDAPKEDKKEEKEEGMYRPVGSFCCSRLIGIPSCRERRVGRGHGLWVVRLNSFVRFSYCVEPT